MRGPGQIAALAAVARPRIGVITSIAPVHLEHLGTIENVARAKAELLAALPPGGTAVVPSGEPLLEPYLRDDVTTVRCGDGGDVRLLEFAPPAPRRRRRGRARDAGGAVHGRAPGAEHAARARGL